MILDLLDVLGRITWEPMWVPVLAWTVLALPLWLVLERTDRLHPLAQYRLSQVLLAALPAGLLATALLNLLSSSMAVAPVPRLSVTIMPDVEAASGSVPAVPTWQWTQAVGLLTIGAAVAALASLGRLVLDATAAVGVRHALDCPPSTSVQNQTDRIARRLGVNRSIRVCLSPKASVPVTLGGLRPTVLLPADLTHRPDALRLALVHECVHVQRYDDLAHLLERIVAGLFVAHPLVGQLQRRITETREQACDAAVLADDRHSSADYARLLLAFAEGPHLQGLDALSLSESPSVLKSRLQTMRSSVSQWLSSTVGLGAALTAVGLLLMLGVVACSDSVAPSSSDAPAEQSSGAPMKNESSGDVYAEVENPPDCGGVRALSKNIQYPETARNAGIEGRVFVEFIVDETGNVTDPQIRRGVHEALDEAALVAVKQLQCEAGTVQGDPVKVKMTLPVTFKLPDDASSESSEETAKPSASAGVNRIVFHDLSEQQQDRVLSDPMFTQARSALNSDISYPELVRKAGIEGRVEVTFTLGESGTPIRPRVTKSLHDALNAMALRSVQNTTFTVSGNQNLDVTGTRISVQFTFGSVSETT